MSCDQPKYWTGVVLQGKGNWDFWVTSVKIYSSINEVHWEAVDGGEVYPANSDRNTKVRIGFDEPVYARSIRIHSETWHGKIALRFDALFIET